MNRLCRHGNPLGNRDLWVDDRVFCPRHRSTQIKPAVHLGSIPMHPIPSHPWEIEQNGIKNPDRVDLIFESSCRILKITGNTSHAFPVSSPTTTESFFTHSHRENVFTNSLEVHYPAAFDVGWFSPLSPTVRLLLRQARRGSAMGKACLLLLIVAARVFSSTRNCAIYQLILVHTRQCGSSRLKP